MSSLAHVSTIHCTLLEIVKFKQDKTREVVKVHAKFIEAELSKEVEPEFLACINL